MEQTERFLGIALYQGKTMKKKANGREQWVEQWVEQWQAAMDSGDGASQNELFSKATGGCKTAEKQQIWVTTRTARSNFLPRNGRLDWESLSLRAKMTKRSGGMFLEVIVFRHRITGSIKRFKQDRS